MDKNKRILNLDLIRFVAVVLVMFVHSQRFLDASLLTAGSESVDYWVKLLLFPIGACNVLFVMVSGALLLGRVDELGTFFRRRLSRILIPFVIWATVAFVLARFVSGDKWGWDTLELYIRQMLTTGTNTAHWFVYMILGIYLFVPLLQRFVKVTEESVLLLTIGVLAALSGRNVLMESTLFDMLSAADCTYFFALMIGYYSFHKWQYKERFVIQNRVGLLLMTVVCIADYLWDITSVPVVVFWSVFLFGLLLVVPLKEGTTFERFYSLISRNCYGIYLTHFMFIPLLFPLAKWVPAWMTPFVFVPVTLVFEAVMFAILERLKCTKYLS